MGSASNSPQKLNQACNPEHNRHDYHNYLSILICSLVINRY